jgi:hypothetical protein
MLLLAGAFAGKIAVLIAGIEACLLLERRQGPRRGGRPTWQSPWVWAAFGAWLVLHEIARFYLWFAATKYGINGFWQVASYFIAGAYGFAFRHEAFAGKAGKAAHLAVGHAMRRAVDRVAQRPRRPAPKRPRKGRQVA